MVIGALALFEGFAEFSRRVALDTLISIPERDISLTIPVVHPTNMISLLYSEKLWTAPTFPSIEFIELIARYTIYIVFSRERNTFWTSKHGVSLPKLVQPIIIGLLVILMCNPVICLFVIGFKVNLITTMSLLIQ